MTALNKRECVLFQDMGEFIATVAERRFDMSKPTELITRFNELVALRELERAASLGPVEENPQ